MATLRQGYPDEDRPAWLDPATLHARRRKASGLRWLVIAAVLIVVAGLAALILWDRTGGGGTGGVIHAEPGPYKVKPADPGGMKVEGRGYASYVASEGVDVAGKLNLDSVPETPVARRNAQPVATPPEEASDLLAGAVQLGAFSTEAKAHAAYKAMKARFAFLAPFEEAVLPAKSGDATVYRLRVPAGAAASAICRRLKVAGETCLVVG